MQILDGRTISKNILADIKIKISQLKVKPMLDIILVGDDPASLKYVAMKQKKAADIGIGGTVHHLPASSTTADVLNLVNRLNSDLDVKAFMIQLPLPPSIDTLEVLNTIDSAKDVDGLTASNLGLLMQNSPLSIASATALGIIELLSAYNVSLADKNVVILGRSSTVGLPLFALFQNANATVTLCHSHTKNLESICAGADILVSAIGKANFVSPTFVKDGAVVIDVGTNYIDTKLFGDVDFDPVSPKCSFITPVPGGVGPMTIAALFINTFRIYDPQSS